MLNRGNPKYIRRTVSLAIEINADCAACIQWNLTSYARATLLKTEGERQRDQGSHTVKNVGQTLLVAPVTQPQVHQSIGQTSATPDDLRSASDDAE